MKKILLSLILLLIFLTGCTSVERYAGSREGQYTLGGAALGAVAGNLIGGHTSGTLIGAGVGAVAGYTAGELTKNKQ